MIESTAKHKFSLVIMKVFSYDFGVPGIVNFSLFEVPLELCFNRGRYCNKWTPPPPAHFKGIYFMLQVYWGKEVLEKMIWVLEKSLFFSKRFCMNYVCLTRGHFACACVNPLNDNNVGASNLMAGNRKLARKITILLKAISLVLWIPYFPTKNIRHDKNRTFSTRVFTRRFFSSRFSWPFKDFQDSTPKSHVPV